MVTTSLDSLLVSLLKGNFPSFFLTVGAVTGASFVNLAMKKPSLS
ncbi:hypothetical protein JCM19235_509 [Vibrio maritimus]|uniref:Uncharacterized protein n=1 Tax=Vibrio maritimus TaxID=990268 RepID=A0A090S3Y7_9VIBR|nr:hypothetical protein JCM19235_509 [Vibrio maritimus]